MDKQRVPTTPPNRDVNAAARASLALQLRAQKLTYESIAHQCGYGSASACRKAILRELNRVIVRDVDQLRDEESVTLDTMQAECMTLFLDKDNKGRLFAADRILAIMERRAKLLGLDAQTTGNVAAAQIVVREVPQGLLEALKS